MTLAQFEGCREPGITELGITGKTGIWDNRIGYDGIRYNMTSKKLECGITESGITLESGNRYIMEMGITESVITGIRYNIKNHNLTKLT